MIQGFKMAFFLWHGLDLQGSRISGAFQFPNRIEARRKLLIRGIFHIHLHKIPHYQLKSPVPLKELVTILLQLERLQKSGFPLNQSLQLIISETKNPRWPMPFVKSARIYRRVFP